MDQLTRERFEAKIDTFGDCHVWTDAKTDVGYGQIRVKGKLHYAHRLAYEMSHGPILADMVIDHKCHNRACVNPDHLQSVTQKQNMENFGPVRTSTGFRGVWTTPRGRYVAGVKHGYKKYHAGVFDTPEEANEAVIALRNRLFSNNILDH